MQNIVFTSTFFCEYCNKDIPLRVFGDYDSSYPETDREIKEAQDWGKHFHWTDFHRRCAICGDLVRSSEGDDMSLELALLEQVPVVHALYKKETSPEQPSNSLLIVHYGCLENKDYGNSDR